MMQKVWRLLAKRIIRFPLSVAVALLIFNAIGVGADQQIIPDWALLKTTQQECPTCWGPTAVPTSPGGGGGGSTNTPTAVPTATDTPVTTATPVPPSAVGGFSSGSWFGTYPPPGYQTQPLPNTKYQYGILDASNGPSGTITLCGGSSSFSPSFSGGEHTLLDHPTGDADAMQAFWFLTSIAYARNVCNNATVTPADWGRQQADWFVVALDALPQNVKQNITGTFADIEIVAGDIAQWGGASPADNQTVISNFFTELGSQAPYCGCGGMLGIYTGPFNWWTIIGVSSTAPSQPYLGATWLWMASYGPADLNGGTNFSLNTQQDWFTVSPGGYYLWSWQYATDACEMSYATAQNWATNASPPIMAFDKWTNSAPDQLCQ